MIDPNNLDLITVDKLDAIALSLSRFFAHCGSNGKLGKSTINDLALFLAPFITSIGGSGFIEVDSNILPDLEIDNGFSFVPKGIYTQTAGDSINATGTINLISWTGTEWSLISAIDVDLSDYATKSDVATEVLTFKVEAVTYLNPRGESELFGNETWFPATGGGKNGIASFLQAENDIIFNSVEFSASQVDTSKPVKFRIYKSSIKTALLSEMTLLKEIDFSAGEFNSNIDALAQIDLDSAYNISAGDWLYLMALSETMSWHFWNADSVTPPFRSGFLYTANNNANEFNENGWDFATSGFQTGMRLKAINMDLKQRFDAIGGVPDTILPSKIYAMRSWPINLYFDGFILGNELKEDIRGFKVAADWNFRGVSYEDMFNYMVQPGDGNGQALALRFYDLYKNLLGLKLSAINVIPYLGLNTDKTVVFMGNSLTAPGYIGQTVQNWINALPEPGNIVLKGSRTENGIVNEGWAGKNIAWFRYDIASPLVNPSTGIMDIPYYFQTVLGFAPGTGPDLINFMEMTNTIGATPNAYVPYDFEYTEAMDNLKAIFQGFIDAGAKKVILQLEPIGSSKSNQGTPVWTKQIFLYNAHVFQRAQLKNFDAFAFNEKVTVGFACAYISRWFGYGSTDEQPNIRFSQDIKQLCSDAIHPIVEGYQSIGDGITPHVLTMLKEID